MDKYAQLEREEVIALLLHGKAAHERTKQALAKLQDDRKSSTYV